MKRILIILVATAVLAGCSRQKPIPASRLEQKGNFSFITPDGWFRTKLPGIDYIIVSTEPDFGAKPNIFVDFVEESAQLSNVVTRVVANNKKLHPSYKVSEQTTFNTDSGLNGVRISAGRINDDKLPLATIHYVLQGSNRVFSITCTCADPVKEKYIPIFDSTMKTMQTD